MPAPQTAPPEGASFYRSRFQPDEIVWRDSGNPDTPTETTLRGHAAVFNALSEDLGGFRELIEPGAFRAALRRNPDVRLLFNHDSSFVLARTASGTLELREDSRGLHVFARVDREISWIDDLRRSMLRGDVDQMSFAFTVADGGDEWAVTDDGTIVRTIRADGVDELFDVTIATFPAYPATEVAMRSLLENAASSGRVRGLELADGGLPSVAAERPGAATGSSGGAAGRGRSLAFEASLRRARARAQDTPRKDAS